MRMNKALFLLTAAAALAGCSTELEINAPYKESTVVYGLLNMRDSIHFVKINKAFLGEGDALVYATIPDSNEYHGEDITLARVVRYQNGNAVDEFPLRDTILEDREPGTFYSPRQKLYYFRENNTYNLPQSNVLVYLDQNSEYELQLEVKGTRLTARTNIVNDFSIRSVDQNLGTEMRFVSPTGDYIDPSIVCNSGVDGKRYNLAYRFHYQEIRGTDTVAKSVTSGIGSMVASGPNEELSMMMEAEPFYSGLANAIPNDPTVDKRRFTGLELMYTVANDDFHTFLSLSEPVSGIVEDRPSWSNIDGGYGIFASRYTKNVGGPFLGKKLDGPSLNELVNGQYTSTRRFCSFFNPGSQYSCD